MIHSAFTRIPLKVQRAFSCGSSTRALHRRTIMSAATSNWTTDSIPDLSGKTFLVTGANAGLGYETSKELARKNAHVVMAARDPAKGDEALRSIRKEIGNAGKMDLMMVDMADFGSVKAFAEEYKSKGFPIHGLINNAGIFLVKNEITPDGFEITTKTNHFGPVLLTLLLLDVVKKSSPSRLVWVGSPAEAFGSPDWNDLKGSKDKNSDMDMYGRTKLFNIMSSTEFNRRLKGTGVESFSCHPGVAKTDLYAPEKMDKDKLTSKVIDTTQKFAGQSQERGALSLLMTATEPSLAGKGGSNWGPNTLNFNNTTERGTSSEEPWDEAASARLLNETIRILEETTGDKLPMP